MKTSSFKTLGESFAMRHEPESYIRAAYSMWTILLVSVAVGMMAGIGHGAWQFFSPPPAIAHTAAESGITGFNKEQLTDVVKFYEAKKTKFETLMSEE